MMFLAGFGVGLMTGAFFGFLAAAICAASARADRDARRATIARIQAMEPDGRAIVDCGETGTEP